MRSKTIALWGLSFKPNTDDMREAASLVLIRGLFALGAKGVAYHPVAGKEAMRMLIAEHRDSVCATQLTFAKSAVGALTGADALVLVTEWKEFRSPDFAHLAETLRDKAIFDGRNIYQPASVAATGLHYEGIGRTTRAAI